MPKNSDDIDNPLPDSINDLREYVGLDTTRAQDTKYYFILILRLVAWLVLDRINEKKEKKEKKEKIKPKFYLLHLNEGYELGEEGPFETESSRLKKARHDWNEDGQSTNYEYNVFWADVDEDGKLTVGAFDCLDADGG